MAGESINAYDGHGKCEKRNAESQEFNVLMC